MAASRHSTIQGRVGASMMDSLGGGHGPRERVVITGIGAITALGCGRDALWDGLLAAESPVRRIARFDPSPFRTHIAAEVDDFDPLDYLDRKLARRLSRFGQFSIGTSRLALQDAGLSLDDEAKERV